MKKRSICILIATILVASLFCGTVSASGIFDLFNNSQNESNQETDKRDIQFARIDEIKDNQVTVTLGTLNKQENSNQTEQNSADSFTAGSQKLTLTAQDEELKEDLTQLKIGDIVRIRYNDQNVLEDIDSANDMRGKDGKHGGKLARIDEISNDKVTLTLGTFNNSQPTDQETTPSENFTAGSEKVTLTAQDNDVKEDLAQLKTGDIVFIRYNDQNVLEDIDKADEMKDKKDGKVAKIDEIKDNQITLTLGSFEKKTENSTTQNTTTNPADNFVAGQEKVTLTVSSDEVKKEVAELKAGDIVFIRYNDKNELEGIHKADEFKNGKRGGQVAKIEQISGDSVVVVLGTLEKKDQSQNTQTTPNPENDFVAGDQRLTLTVTDEDVKEELQNLKSGDVVMIRYNDQNVLEDIHNFEDGFKGGRHGRGRQERFSENTENTTQNQNNVQTSNLAA